MENKLLGRADTVEAAVMKRMKGFLVDAVAVVLVAVLFLAFMLAAGVAVALLWPEFYHSEFGKDMTFYGAAALFVILYRMGANRVERVMKRLHGDE